MTDRPAPRPVTQADYDQVRELHAQGLSRNAIAEQIARSGRTVSRLAGEMGLSFDRARTRAATEAKKDDARAKRAQLANDLLDDAARLRRQLWQPADYVDHGGKEYDRVDWTLDEPTFADKLKIMQAVGIAADKAVRLDEYDADPGIDAAKSMLGALAKGLGAAYDQLNQASTDADAG
ncbi:helix-turn-helix domain-containing protein [Micromonospora sp. KC213]|uniref:helix-turn-helix domain-containing protein n=1 Tax=Micromonospora sp. KC213 TaxID=2530378 RepID=UPI00104573A4|nr:helix-turn-helix domain-containing protein [Micromonospora sp. KC213]TDC42080.1 helix-turn-helix domain-containing protein [Micromonospora sp. KC213]